MTFADALNRFVIKTKGLTTAVHIGVATKAHESIVSGSPITGAPGQPVDTGALRDSWTLAIGLGESRITTNVAYARTIEDGISASGKAIAFKSPTGGAHSVKLTVAGASRLQAAALAELGGGQ